MARNDPSILQRLEAEGRQPPRVRLRSEETEAPALRQTGRFEILGELAQGGVGQVLRGRDVDLGRDVALKVLRADHVSNAEIVQRFVDEAQIGGQLQHPGIVPVYELGLQADERPFFAMKLVKGQTLAAQLRKRADAGDKRRHFLQVFEQVCQTVAYAHARGVIHRDLKPANVMIGAFGEVQVLDWGFAKVLPRGGIADERTPKEVDVTRIATLRSQKEGSDSIAGSVMGTPAYMPPEQALGQVELMDERSDVFSLGAILCEILTGKPPYIGDDALIQAAQARLEDALLRLDACGADARLVALAKRSLSPMRAERPADATAVAEATHAHLAEVEERAHRSALAAAEARARADQASVEASEQHRARRLSVAVGASLLLAMVIGVWTYVWLAGAARERARRTGAAVADAIREAQYLRGEGRWAQALVAAQQAQELARAGGVDANTRQRARSLAAAVTVEEAANRKETAEAARDAALLAKLADIRMRSVDHFDLQRTHAESAAAFREYGLDLAAMSPEQIATKLRDRGIHVEVAASLDYWALTFDWGHSRIDLPSDEKTLRPTSHAGQEKLIEMAMLADPDPLRNRARRVLLTGDANALDALAKEAVATDLGPETAEFVGTLLHRRGKLQAAAAVLERAQRRHPDNLWINIELGYMAYLREDHRTARRYYSAALALRPESAMLLPNLAASCIELKEHEEAIELAQRSIRLLPSNPVAYSNLASALASAGRPEEAAAAARKAIELDPTLAPAHGNLAAALNALERQEEAMAVSREAVRLLPQSWRAHYTLGIQLQLSDHIDEAIAEFREAVRLRPDAMPALSGLSIALSTRYHYDEAIAVARRALRLAPNNPALLVSLGAMLCDKGDYAEALDPLRKAVRLDPGSTDGWSNLGGALVELGRHEEALSALKEAIRLDPDLEAAHCNLAHVHSESGRAGDALAICEELIRRNPDSVGAYDRMGHVLAAAGRIDDAIRAFENALQVDPERVGSLLSLGALYDDRKGEHDKAYDLFRKAATLAPTNMSAHYNLGNVLRSKERYDEAIAEYREAIRLQPTARAYAGLGEALGAKGLVEEALAACREAVRLGPDQPNAYLCLGNALGHKGLLGDALDAYREAIRLDPDRALYHTNAGAVLGPMGRLDEAIEEFHEAIRLDRDDGRAYQNLCTALEAKGLHDEAIEAGRVAVRLRPATAGAHHALGNALKGKGLYDEAIATYREAIRLEPSHAKALSSLGSALAAQGKLDEAIATHREAVRLQPGLAELHMNLGYALQRNGEFEEALSALRRGHELGSRQPGWTYPSAQLVERAETFVALAKKLDAVLAGEAQPAGARERIGLAQICRIRKQHVVEARFYRDALAVDPDLAQTYHRYNGACAAALAGCGRGSPPLASAEERVEWRKQALAWLRLDLTGGQSAEVLAHWQRDPDLAAVRDEIDKLPEDEREAWRALWAEVREALGDG